MPKIKLLLGFWTAMFCLFMVFLPSFALATEKYRIACFVRSLEDKFWDEFVQKLQSKLSQTCELYVFDAGNDPDVQLRQVKTLLDKEIDLVLMNIVQTAYTTEVLNTFKVGNIPSIFFKNEPNIQFFQGHENAILISGNGEEEGRLQGKLIQQLATIPKYDKNKDGKIQYVLFQGPLGNFDSITRSMYFELETQERGVKLEQLGDPYICDWQNDCAYTAMSEIMKKYGEKLELILSNNDDMALGALRYLNEQGLNLISDDIAIMGFNGTKAAQEKIAQGVFTATIVYNLDEIVFLLEDMIYNHLSGKDWLYATGYQWDVDNISVQLNGSYLSMGKEGFWAGIE